ncbi:M28 family peptidase [Tautonia marina]|uniref:M28 family peptidase n=1 Tax=Tautonia marina TaxID=2653855 RepID=UPI00191C1D6A|nr:M28 family peptidase [Tautonia marina]
MTRRPAFARRVRITAGIMTLALLGAAIGSYSAMIRMPGRSHRGPLPPLDQEQESLRAMLARSVDLLAVEIGGRSLDGNQEGLARAADALGDELSRFGYEVERQSFEVRGRSCSNLIVEIPGSRKPDEIVVVGAHYDSCGDAPAANDNASGVAATLALAHSFAAKRSVADRTLRFVLFTNEEPPFFQTETMGSRVYARRCRARGEAVVAMLCLETIGFYSDEPGSQQYPFPLSAFYPSRGNFIGFVGDLASRKLVRRVVGSFRSHAAFPSEGTALPGGLPGVGWSDHWSFWQEGYPAVMVTDTAPFRYPQYHTPEDTPDKLDFDRMARVVAGLDRVIADLIANPSDPDFNSQATETAK